MRSETPKRYKTDVDAVEWEIIEPFTRQKPGRGRRRTVNIREVVNAIFYLNKTGCHWDMLPRDFPDHRHVNYYYVKWMRDGTWDAIEDALRRCVRVAEGREELPSMAMIDSQSVKTDHNGEERGFDGHKRVKGRKRHIAVDTLGFVLCVLVTCAATRDADAGQELCDVLQHKQTRLKKVLVDSAYRGECVDYAASQCRFQLEVVQKLVDQKGFQVQPWRWIVERTFAWFTHFRRLSKDYEKTTESSETMIKIANIRLMLQRLSNKGLEVFNF